MRRRVEFDGSFRVRDKDIRARGNTYTTGAGQRLRYVHPPSWCEGRPCVVHHPTDHSMRQFPTKWRSDRGIMERICPHGVGHPDPDDQWFHLASGRFHEGVHGCDGCCLPPHEEDCAKVGGYPDDCNCSRRRRHSDEWSASARRLTIIFPC